MNQEELDKAVERVKQYMKKNKFLFKECDISPCKNCGRMVYVGKCCDNPDYSVEVKDDEVR